MRIHKSLFAALAATLALGSCTDYTNGFDAKSHEYQENFVKQFGEPDPKQDWSMAVRTTANINLSSIKGDAVVTVFSGNPNISSKATVLGKSVIKDGVGSFNFYSVRGNNDVYVLVQQNNNSSFFNHYSIENGNVYVGKFATRSFTEDDCPTTLASETKLLKNTYVPLNAEPSEEEPSETVEVIVSGVGNTSGQAKTEEEWITYTQNVFDSYSDKKSFLYNDGDSPFEKSSIIVYGEAPNQWSEMPVIGLDFSNYILKDGCYKDTRTVGGDDGGSTTTYERIKLQYLDNVEKSAAEPWNFADNYDMFAPGQGGFFEESVPYNSDGEKLNVYYNEAQMREMEKGYSVLTKKNDIIELPFIFGVTDFTNQFGYIYWKDSESASVDPLSLPHYVLIEDARPQSNVYYNSYGGTPVTHNSLNDWGDESMNGYKYALAHRYDDITCYCTDGADVGYYATGKHLPSCQQPMEIYNNENKSIYGTTYRPVFFGKDGNASKGSYVWPEGYRIVFFILTLSKSYTDNTLVSIENRSKDNAPDGENLNRFNYSLPELNKRILGENGGNGVGHLYQFGAGTDRANDGLVKCIPWQRTDENDVTTTYLCFGDNSGDEDLNDIVFIVRGGQKENNNIPKVVDIKWHLNLKGIHDTTDKDLHEKKSLNVGGTYYAPENNPSVEGRTFKGWSTSVDGSTGLIAANFSGLAPEGGICYYAQWEGDNEEVETQKWILACEDLGGSFDYDFNDIVFELSQNITTNNQFDEVTYGDIQVKVLASGGILPVKLVYGNTTIGGEIHSKAYGQSADNEGKFVPVNVAKGSLVEAKAIGTIPSNGTALNLNDIKNNIKVVVSDNSADGDFIVEMNKDKDSKTPQILILPGNWRWPLEYKSIDSAYPYFPDWVKDSKNADWMSNMNEDVLIDR